METDCCLVHREYVHPAFDLDRPTVAEVLRYFDQQIHVSEEFLLIVAVLTSSQLCPECRERIAKLDCLGWKLGYLTSSKKFPMRQHILEVRLDGVINCQSYQSTIHQHVLQARSMKHGD